MSEQINHHTFMEAALAEANAALQSGDFPVGCVMVFNDTIVARGSRRNSGAEGNEIDHAEMVALRTLVENRNGIDLSEVRVYSTMEPCLMCYSTLILSGIRTIVYGYEDVMGGGTKLDFAQLPPLYAAMKITIIPGVKRSKCLKLFKMFFSDRANEYWQDSLLARYTLDQ